MFTKNPRNYQKALEQINHGPKSPLPLHFEARLVQLRIDREAKLETLVVGEKLLKEIIEAQDPRKSSRSKSSHVYGGTRRIRSSLPSANAWRTLKERHEKGLLTSLAFVKLLLELAKDVVAA